jgi:hypothetical protein
MAKTINRRLAELIDGSGQLQTGKLPNAFITTAHYSANSITDAKLHTSFSLPASALTARDTGDLSEGSNLYYTTARWDSKLAAADTGDLSEGSNLYYTDARVGTYISGDRSYGNITTTGYIAGPASMVIDPAGVGDNTGTVVIAGNLQVDGTTTTINSTTVSIDDLNFTIASDAADSSAANGAGITIGGASATMLYTHATTSFDFNKPVNVTGVIASTGNVDVGGTVLVGNNNTIIAENNIRFKAPGASYIDIQAIDQDLIFRTSETTALDTNALRIDGSAGGAATFSSTISSGAITSSGTGSFTGGGNTLSIAKGSGSPALAFLGTATDPQTSALIEGIVGGGLKFYTSTGTLSSPSWSPKITLAANGYTTFAGAISATGSANSGSAAHLPALLGLGSYGGGIATRDTKESGWYQQTNGADWHFYHNRTVASDTPASKKVLSFNSTGAASFNASVTVDSTLLLSPEGNNDLIKSTGGVLYLKANELSIQDNSGNQKVAIDTNILLDTAGIIVLDADNAGVVQLKDGGSHYGSFFTSSDSFNIQSNISDADIIFKGNDGGSGITALTLDMSAAGAATFNAGINLAGTLTTTAATPSIILYESDTTDANTQLISASGDFRIRTRSDDGNTNTDRLRIDHATGSVLIGQDSGDSFNSDSMLRIQRAGDRVFQQFKCDADQNIQILFGDVDDDVECSIQYYPANQNLVFATGNNTDALTLDSSQNATFANTVKIGTDPGGDAFNTTSPLMIGSTTNAYINIKAGTGHAGGLLVGDSDDDFVGGFIYSNSTNDLTLYANNNERMNIKSTGQIHIGYDSIGGSAGTAGVILSDGGKNGSLGTTLGDTQRAVQFHNLSHNADFLTFRTRRITNGQAGWNHAVWDITRDIDNTSDLYRYMTFGIGDLVINEFGDNLDFRVETDSYSHALFVDASSNSIIFGRETHSWTANNFHIASPVNGGIAVTANGDWGLQMAGSRAERIRFFSSAGGTTTVGNVSVNTTSTTYSTTSDRRLKENIQTLTDATDKLMAMNPVEHTWKADPEADPVHGFIAQEMMDIVPEAVTGDPEGEEMMAMDYGRITPIIVAALQDALKEINELKTRINELEGK